MLTENILKTKLFEQGRRSMASQSSCDLLSFTETQIQMPGNCSVSKFLRRSVEGKNCGVFMVKPHFEIPTALYGQCLKQRQRGLPQGKAKKSTAHDC